MSPNDEPCRHCAGTGTWQPQGPRRDPETGAIGWVAVSEPCRMCRGTGRHLHEECGLPAVP